MDPSSLNPIQDNDREAPYVEHNLELMLVLQDRKSLEPFVSPQAGTQCKKYPLGGKVWLSP